jgi:Ca-activated chloride channel family protein
MTVALTMSAWTVARGQELVVPEPSAAPVEEAAVTVPAGASAPALVREGNSALLAKDFEAALQRYTQAKTLRPDALELDFNRGLGLFATGKLAEAREAFERAALSPDAALAEGSHYGQAAVDHMEAMSAEDLKQTVAKLERAMRRYHDILQTNPEHAAAREANRKAATLWRQAREELQKQPPQQDQQGEGEDQEEKPEQKPEDQPQQQEGEPQEDSKPQEGEPSQEQQEPQKGQQSPGEEQQPQDAEPQESEAEETEEGEQAEATEQEESASQEQAQRELRRLVDQLRERMKRQRREDPGPSRPAPVEKDW